MAFTVVYDACALYPMSLRDLLVRIGQTDLVRARWTDDILDEAFRHIVEKKPELKDKLVRTYRLMNEAIRDVCITGHEMLIPALCLPDPDDRHVLAAAIRAGAQVIVTFNLKDFPSDVLRRFDLEAQHPDEFVRHMIDLDVRAVLEILTRMARARKNPTMCIRDVLGSLRTAGLTESVRTMEAYAVAAGVDLASK